MGVHKLYYDEKSKNSLSGAMRAKGWDDFEISGSRIKNKYSGYWVTSDSYERINCMWLGQTYKDALWTVRIWDKFPVNEALTND